MTRLTVLFCVSLSLFAPAPGRAADAMKAALAAIPADAVAFVCAPSLKQADDDFQRMVNALGLGVFLPPPSNSPAALLGQYLQLAEQLDENGAVALVLLPFEVPAEAMTHLALIVPAKDPRAALEAMSAQVGEGGVWTLTLAGQPVHAVAGDKRLVVASTPEVAKSVAGSKTGIAGQFEPVDLALFDGLDVVLWLNAEQLLKQFKLPIDGFMNMLTMMQTAAGGLQAKQAEANKRNLDMLIEGTSSVTVGLGLDQPGLTLRFGARTKAGSELAKRTKAPKVSGPLLRGLPADNYMVVFGQAIDPDQSRQGLDFFDPFFTLAEEAEGVDAKQVGRLKSIVQEWAPLTTAVQGAATTLKPGPDGLVGLALVLETTDSGKWLDLAQEAADIVLKLVTAEGLDIDEDIKTALSGITYTADAAESAGAKTDHLKFDQAKLLEVTDIDEEWIEDLLKIIGQDGFVVRLAPATPRAVVVTFGGGSKYAADLIEKVKAGRAPLEADPGIQKVSAHLPKERYAVGFAAVDRILAFVAEIVKVIEEDEEFPVRMPKLDAPAAMSVSGGENWMRGDVFVPTELIVATKDAIMMMMGTGGPGPAQVEQVPDEKDEG